MSFAEFLFGKKVKISAGEFEFIELDCTENETYTHDSDVTNHPIEEGANVSDHYRPLADRIVIEGLVSNHSIAKTGVNLDFTRSEDVYAILRDWRKQALRLSLTTGLDEFDDLVLKSFTVTRDKFTGESLPVRLEFLEIQTVESQLSTATAPIIKAAKKKKAAQKKAKKEEKRLSRIKDGLKKVKAFFGGS
jgi:hypothetical protein